MTATTRLHKDGFSVERRGEGDATTFAYAGHLRRFELSPRAGVLTVFHSDVEASAHLDAVVEALWELAIPGVVDAIEVSYRAGDPNETVTVRSRASG